MTNDEQNMRRWMAEQAEYNESFRGEVLDDAKMARLNRLRALCRELAEIESGAESPFCVFDNTCQNGMAQIRLPEVYVFNTTRGRNILSELFARADDVMASAASGRITLTFGVRDTWKTFTHEGYDE